MKQCSRLSEARALSEKMKYFRVPISLIIRIANSSAWTSLLHVRLDYSGPFPPKLFCSLLLIYRSSDAGLSELPRVTGHGIQTTLIL